MKFHIPEDMRITLSAIGKLIIIVACNVGAFFWFSALAAILNVKSIGKLGRVHTHNITFYSGGLNTNTKTS